MNYVPVNYVPVNYVIVLFGLAIVATAAVMLIRPVLVIDLMRQFAGAVWLHVTAVGVRLVLGIVLITYADQSRFPLTLQFLGGLAIVAAIILALIPRSRFADLIEWVFARFAAYARVAGLVAMLFGGFLIYAVI